MKTLSPRPLAVAVAVLIALLVASIPAWADVGVLGDPPPTAPGPFTTQPPAFGRDPAPTWSWQASTPGGGASIARYHVRVKQDSHDWVDAVPAIVNAPNTSWSPSPAFSADGIYQIAVQAEDGDGVKSEWAVSSTYVLDTTPPNVALSVPDVGLETNDANIVFTGTAEDLPWGIAAVHWTVTDPSGNPVAGSAQFTEPNAAFTPSSALSIQGIYTVRLFAEDRAGNTATAERSFRLDTIAPTMTQYELLTARSRMLHGDLYISDTQPRIRVVASDGSSGSGFNVEGRLEIEVFSDGAVPERVEGTVLRTPARPTLNAEAWTAVWSPSSPMTSGRYYPWITIIDDAGNRLERGGPAYGFVIDADPPRITGDSSVGKLNTGNGRQFTNNRHPLITWPAASDPNLPSGFPGVELSGAGVAGYQLEIWTKREGQSKPQGTKVYTAPGVIDPWADLMPITPTEGPVEQHTPAAELNGLKDGVSYGAWILVRDRVGNMPQAGAEPEWVDPPFVFDSSPPSLPGIPTVVNAVGGRMGTGRPTIRWAHATDERSGVTQSGVDGYEVRMKHAGAAGWDVLTTFVDLDPDEDVDCTGADSRFEGDFDWVVPQLLANGRYELVVRARDVAGNVSPGWTETMAFTVDTTPLDPPEAPYTMSPTNNSRPEWTWPAVAGAVSYGVYLDGAWQVDVAPEAPGAPLTWAPAEGAELTEGRCYLQVTAVNDLGNKSEKSAPGYVDIDLTPPEAPVMQALPEYMNTDEVLFQWVAGADAVRYELEHCAGEADSEIVPADVAQYELSTLLVADGAAIWGRARAYDAAGNVSGWASPAARTIIDRACPTVNAVVIPDTPTTNPRPTWAWIGDDGELGSGVSHYVVTLDSAGPFETIEASFTPASDLADGIHVLRVKGTDRVGNIGAALVFQGVVVDTLPPAAPAVEPIAKGYNTSPLTLRWNAVSDGGNAVAYVLQWAKDAGFSGANDIPVGPVEGVPEREFDFTGPGRGEGEYWFRVKTISTVNGSTTPPQTKESGWSAVVSTIYDVTGPAAPALTLATPSPTNQSPQTWNWTAPAGATGYKVSVDGAEWTDVQDTRTYQTAFDTTGTHAFVVEAYDWLGNDGETAAGSVEVDVTAPDAPGGLALVSESVVIDGKRHTADNTPNIKWDPSSSAVEYRVEADGQAWIHTTDFVYEFTEGVEDGEHAVRVSAADALGNWSQYSDRLVFVVDTKPPLPPGTPSAATPINHGSPVWSWAAAEGAVRYRVFEDEVDRGFVADPTYESSSLLEGAHYLQVTALDILGNESDKSAPGYVVVDLTPPAAPVMQALPKFTNKEEALFQWEAEADAVRFMLRYVVGDEDHTEVPVGVKRYELGISEFEDGITIQARVRAFDTAGNAGNWSGAVSTTIDRTGPNVILLEPTAETHTNGLRPVWKWSAEEDGTSPAKDYTVTLAPEGQDQSTFWVELPEFVPVSDLPSGKYVLKVAARDELGNVGREQSFPAVYVVAPMVSTPIPSPGAYPVNKVSTLAFSVHGIWDAELEIKANDKPVPEENLIMLLRSPALTKFYVLIDANMAEPGQRLTIKVKAGDMIWEFGYDVLTERSGFGFGRLRPWDW